MTRRSAALATAAAAALAAAAIPVASGGAQDTSTAVRTITVKFKATGNSYFADVAPKSPKGPPRVSIGDRFVGIQSVTFDGRPGTLHTDSVITNRTPAGFERFTAILHSVLHLADGDIYATGFVDSAGKGDRSEIVGGSGA